MFLVNSRHPLFCAPRPGLPPGGAPFSRSYGGILPSSFNTVRSHALVCSTSPPVSVSGTVYVAGAVSRKPCGRPRNPISGNDGWPSSRPGRRRNVNPLPIGYGLRPRLRGPANPARINLAQEPLDLRRAGFSPALTLLMSAFALPMPPAPLARRLRRPTERSATTPEDRRSDDSEDQNLRDQALQHPRASSRYSPRHRSRRRRSHNRDPGIHATPASRPRTNRHRQKSTNSASTTLLAEPYLGKVGTDRL